MFALPFDLLEKIFGANTGAKLRHNRITILNFIVADGDLNFTHRPKQAIRQSFRVHPIVAHADLDDDRDVECCGGFHFAFYQYFGGLDLGFRAFE